MPVYLCVKKERTMFIYAIQHLFQKIVSLAHCVQGWAAALLFFVADYFAGHQFTVFFVLSMTLMDACWGIAVSVHRGQFTLSELARLTIAKLAVYGCALFFFVSLDRIADTVFSTSIVGAAIAAVEFWSSCGSMLILFPNFLFLRLLRKALTGEIASKLNISEEEVKDILKDK